MNKNNKGEYEIAGSIQFDNRLHEQHRYSQLSLEPGQPLCINATRRKYYTRCVHRTRTRAAAAILRDGEIKQKREIE